MKLSVIICTYNREKYIYNVLQSIAENDFSQDLYEIVFVDNNSADNTQLECTRFQVHYPNVEFRYYNEKKQGLSHARNKGVVESKGEWLIFIDDDALVDNNYLKNLSVNLDQYPNAVAFGGKITPLFESTEYPKWMSHWSYSWVSALDLGDKAKKIIKKYPIGANMGIKRSIIEKSGYFNINLGRNKSNLLGGEEKDLFNRIKALNGTIYYFPNVRVQHIIPSIRTTKEFVQQMALGIGKSEKIRSQSISQLTYAKRIISELIKWTATITLVVYYSLKFTPSKGTILVFFRKNVSLGLLGIK